MVCRPEEIIFTPPKIDKESYAKYLESASRIDLIFDQLIPRNSVSNPNIVIDINEYLSRLGTLKRKYLGSLYRYEEWLNVVGAHKKNLENAIKSMKKEKNKKKKFFKVNEESFELSLRDLKVENEFESYLSTVASLFDVTARFTSSFLKGSEQCHSLSGIHKITRDKTGFKELSKLIENAENSWIDDLKTRRDSTTHYIMISAHSKYNLRENSGGKKENTVIVGIPRLPTKGKSILIWLEDIPVIGGQRQKSSRFKTNKDSEVEAHEIFDVLGRSILRYNGKINTNFDLIDGEKYICDIRNNLETFIFEILMNLCKKVKCI
ncbi:MAG: hypothetical protein PHY02_01370 [Phycisphaerae bacterium]|nr:hypothetical protein [Phycisphaerae bacterium]